ncbi:hypothetical protein GQ600_27397 [Phytophthora cactorum]|nr:hypothetical protein GQ600_27397 [Phytophthora cactorum]
MIGCHNTFRFQDHKTPPSSRIPSPQSCAVYSTCAVAVAVFARSSVVVASTNADESQVLSKTSPDFTVDAMISTDSQKRFLRVTDPEDDDLKLMMKTELSMGASKISSQSWTKKNMNHVAEILENMSSIHKKALKAKVAENAMTKEEYKASKSSSTWTRMTRESFTPILEEVDSDPRSFSVS